MRLAILFHRLGPYHRVRLEAAARLGEIWCIEGGGVDTTYAWDAVTSGGHFHRLTLFPNADSGQMPVREVRRAVASALDRVNPAVVAIPGWEDRLALAALEWAVKTRKAIVLMSDSNEFDVSRNVFKEWVKRCIVALCAAGLVAGTTAADYLEKLGMNRRVIFPGYDVVDNEHFTVGAAKARNLGVTTLSKYRLPPRYFLASARFVEKKNLARLIEAYARYKRLSVRKEQGNKTETWDLVLLGDGPLKRELGREIAELGLAEDVRLPGFKQYDELPTYYGLASAFVHASTVDQWGLVVNEAMAAGLPVLVSNRCGCVPDLLQEGVNGFSFDPLDVEQLASLMFKLSTLNSQLSTFGAASRDTIKRWSPEVFAENLWKAVEVAISSPTPKPRRIDRVLLWMLIHLR